MHVNVKRGKLSSSRLKRGSSGSMQKRSPSAKPEMPHGARQWISTRLRPLLFLTAVAVGLTLSGCTSVPGTVTRSPAIPTACKEKCEYPPLPPDTEVEADRKNWEYNILESAGACFDLHRDCVQGLIDQNGD